MQEGMMVVGVDVGAETFAAAVLRDAKDAGAVKHSVANSAEGFEDLVAWLGERGVSQENAAVCLEATGVYGEALCYYLSSRGYQVAVESPLKVKRSFAQSAPKNDTVDARQIAEYAHRFYDELEWWTPPTVVVEQVRVLLSAREQFTAQRVANVNARKALHHKVITSLKAEEAYEQAIAQLSENIQEIDRELKRLIKEDDSFHRLIQRLTSTPGIGMLLAANLVVLTNGFARTQNHKQIASYAGICPLEHTSGTSVYRRPRSRQYGPPRIRKLLYLAAMSVSVHNAQFRAYYLRKVAEGKPKRLVLNNIANKLLKVVCALVRSETIYIPNYTSVRPTLLRSA
jgi:transposase